jgi:hypothetical protein
MQERPVARVLYTLTALSAAIGLAVSLGIAITGAYPEPALERGLFQNAGENAIGRIADWAMYFTHWSNLLVAVVFGLLAARTAGRGRLLQVLLFDALLMIIVTGLVYNAIIAPGAPAPHGWSLVANVFVHQIAPVAAVAAWTAVGPRGWLHRALIPAALVIPVVWILLTLARGAVIDAYPYGFINVVQLGHAMAILNVLAILLMGIGILFLLIGVDRLARRWSP